MYRKYTIRPFANFRFCQFFRNYTLPFNVKKDLKKHYVTTFVMRFINNVETKAAIDSQQFHISIQEVNKALRS